MTADQLKVFLHARNPERWSRKRLDSMTVKQLRGFAHTRRNGGFTIHDVFAMTPTQMRRACQRVCPGLWAGEDLNAMDEHALRQALLHRLKAGVRYYGESDLAGLSTEQLRTALMLQQPGMYDDVDTMTTRALRAALRKGRRFAYTRADLDGLSVEQLRAVLRAQDPLTWTAQRVGRMSEREIRAIVYPRDNGFTAGDLHYMNAPQLREAMDTLCPGLFSAAELQSTDAKQLRQQLWARMAPGQVYLRESDLLSMHTNELRTAILGHDLRSLNRNEIARMDAATLRKELQKRRRLGYTEKVISAMHVPAHTNYFRHCISCSMCALLPPGYRRHVARTAAHRAQGAQPETLDQGQALGNERERVARSHAHAACERIP